VYEKFGILRKWRVFGAAALLCGRHPERGPAVLDAQYIARRSGSECRDGGRETSWMHDPGGLL
jgi:hypothetical protein